MSGPPAGVVAANTRITDDADAIARRRRAECHQLTVLHHIRMRGQAVISAMNTTGGPDSSPPTSQNPSSSQQSRQEPSHNDGETFQMQGRRGPSQYDDAASEREPSTSTRARPPPSNRSVLPTEAGSQRFPYSTTNTTHAEDSSDSHECRSYWCLIRDILVCYAVIGVTYLLFQFWMLSADAFSPSDEEYDFIP